MNWHFGTPQVVSRDKGPSRLLGTGFGDKFWERVGWRPEASSVRVPEEQPPPQQLRRGRLLLARRGRMDHGHIATTTEAK
jgi:hypothetical protein